jgi:hypothetical protein
MYKRKKLKGTNYEDALVRNKIIEFANEMWNLKLRNNKKKRKIDLLGIEDPELGVEVENGHWNGNFWKTPSYCNISALGFSTINIPQRKEKYWKEYNMWYKKLRHNAGWNKNIFVRTNIDFSQIIVIRPETITNPLKLYRSSFVPNNSDELEDWLSFKKDDVETYNLINGKYILENERN